MIRSSKRVAEEKGERYFLFRSLTVIQKVMSARTPHVSILN